MLRTRRFVGPMALIPVMVAAMLLLTAGGGRAAVQTPLGENLLKNPGGETGKAATYQTDVLPIPHWNTTEKFTFINYENCQGTCPRTSEAVRVGGGKHVFAGGGGTLSKASQVMAILGRNTAIDRGNLKATISAQLAGYDTQGDNARVVGQFLDKDGKVIGKFQTAAVSATDERYRLKSATATIPAGTRKIRVTMVATWVEGLYNDAYFDNLGLVITTR